MNKRLHYDKGGLIEMVRWEQIRNKSLSNLVIICENLKTWDRPRDKKTQVEFRQEAIKLIMKWLGCNKRTAYDYIQTIELLGSQGFTGFNEMTHAFYCLYPGKRKRRV